MPASPPPRSFAATTAARAGTRSPALTQHPTRERWHPGAGGLCLHSIVVDNSRAQRMFVGISAVGVFRTRGRRGVLAGRQPGDARRISPGKISRIRPVRSQAAHERRRIPGALSAKSLRRLSQFRRGKKLAGDFGGAAFGFRVSPGRSSPPARHDLRAAAQRRGIPLSARRQAARLPQPRRGRNLGGADGRLAAGKRLCRHLPGRHGHGRAGPGGSLFRHQHGKNLQFRRRRRFLAPAGRQPAARSIPSPRGLFDRAGSFPAPHI